MTIPISYYLILSAIVFFTGVMGVLIRRNIIAILLSVELMLNKTGMSVDDISLFLFHQANMRIIDAVAEQVGIPHEKMINNLSRYGNTSAASIPLVLDEAMQGNRIRTGDTVLMCGFGTGLTWGTGLFRW